MSVGDILEKAKPIIIRICKDNGLYDDKTQMFIINELAFELGRLDVNSITDSNSDFSIEKIINDIIEKNGLNKKFKGNPVDRPCNMLQRDKKFRKEELYEYLKEYYNKILKEATEKGDDMAEVVSVIKKAIDSIVARHDSGLIDCIMKRKRIVSMASILGSDSEEETKIININVNEILNISDIEFEFIVVQYLDLVYKIAHKWKFRCNSRVDFDDLVQTGVEVLMSAIYGFDPDKSSFMTYASVSIENRIKSLLNRNSSSAYMPVNKSEGLNRFRVQLNNLEQKLGHEPTLEDIICDTGYSEDDVIELLSCLRKNVELDAPVSNSKDDGNAIVYQFVPSPDASDYSLKLTYDDYMRIFDSIPTLTPVQKYVLFYRFTTDESYEKIAHILKEKGFYNKKKNNALSRQRIEQIFKAALLKFLKSPVGKEYASSFDRNVVARITELQAYYKSRRDRINTATTKRRKVSGTKDLSIISIMEKVPSPFVVIYQLIIEKNLLELNDLEKRLLELKLFFYDDNENILSSDDIANILYNDGFRSTMGTIGIQYSESHINKLLNNIDKNISEKDVPPQVKEFVLKRVRTKK